MADPGFLDWRHHKIGEPRPCRYCERPAMCRDASGRAAHKVCAEARSKRKTAAAAASYEKGTLT